MTPEDDFPYEYVGGGYFRQKGVPKGQPADMLHGQQAIDYVLAKLEEARQEIARLYWSGSDEDDTEL